MYINDEGYLCKQVPTLEDLGIGNSMQYIKEYKYKVNKEGKFEEVK